VDVQEPRPWWTSGLLGPEDVVVVGGRRRWVRAVDDLLLARERIRGVRFECPCCRYPTLRERAGYEICFLCGWEDDGQDDPFADQVRGGPNYHLSLTKARENFRTYRDSCAPLEDRSLTRDTETEWTAKGMAIAAFEEMRLTVDPARLKDI
jgi:hypothetical protein